MPPPATPTNRAVLATFRTEPASNGSCPLLYRGADAFVSGGLCNLAACCNLREYRVGPMPDSQLFKVQARWVVCALLVCALTVSLATRTSAPRAIPGTAAQSEAPSAVRQHLDADAAEWSPPVLAVAIAEIVSFYPRIAPAGPPIPALFFEESLYNRPPPSC
jgi:hypothetical protein